MISMEAALSNESSMITMEPTTLIESSSLMEATSLMEDPSLMEATTLMEAPSLMEATTLMETIVEATLTMSRLTTSAGKCLIIEVTSLAGFQEVA